jgi:hypothetical protein
MQTVACLPPVSLLVYRTMQKRNGCGFAQWYFLRYGRKKLPSRRYGDSVIC